MVRFEGRTESEPGRPPGRGKRYRLRGAEAPVEDEKAVVGRVERAKAEQRSWPTYRPRSDHPWRRSFKAEAAGTAAG